MNRVRNPRRIAGAPACANMPKLRPAPSGKEKRNIEMKIPGSRNAAIFLSRFPRTIPTRTGTMTAIRAEIGMTATPATPRATIS